jgi:predicted nucleotidyltransferase component of viral defense system
MENLDYRMLYRIQDRVLEIVSGTDTDFYLTGGTCLNRFFFKKRHSADLDLFSNDNNLFREDVRAFLDALTANAAEYEVLVDSRDFVRLLVESKLKVDLVNDRVFRFGRSTRNHEGVVLDNTANIAANKLCAVLGRDDPKDVFDLYTLFCHAGLDWGSVLAASGKKCAFDREVLEYRLNSFPVHLVDLLPVISQSFTADFKKGYDGMVTFVCSSDGIKAPTS